MTDKLLIDVSRLDKDGEDFEGVLDDAVLELDGDLLRPFAGIRYSLFAQLLGLRKTLCTIWFRIRIGRPLFVAPSSATRSALVSHTIRCSNSAMFEAVKAVMLTDVMIVFAVVDPAQPLKAVSFSL